MLGPLDLDGFGFFGLCSSEEVGGHIKNLTYKSIPSSWDCDYNPVLSSPRHPMQAERLDAECLGPLEQEM